MIARKEKDGSRNSEGFLYDPAGGAEDSRRLLLRPIALAQRSRLFSSRLRTGTAAALSTRAVPAKAPRMAIPHRVHWQGGQRGAQQPGNGCE